MILLDAKGLAMSRPDKPLFSDISLTMDTGDRIGIVGVNGSGKSTLLRVLTGEMEPETGVVRRGRGVRIATLEQRPSLPSTTVLEAVEAVAGEQPWQAAAVLDRLGLAAFSAASTETLSGGQAKRVSLARALVRPSDLLVLDEPTNHLDLEAVEWLENHLAGWRAGLILVTHDRHLLDRVTTRVLELDRGRGYVHDGGYTAYLEGRARREQHEAGAEATRRILARRELAWLRRGAPARTRKSKARVERATALVDHRPEAAVRLTGADLADLARGDGAAARGWGVNRHVGTPRLGDKVIELEGVAFAWPGTPPLLADVDLLLGPGDRLGVVGPNGAGKSTLLDLLAGRREPDEGRVEVGPTVRLEVFDQQGTDLDPAQRVCDAVAGAARTPDWRDAALLEQFWFGPDAQRAPIGLLSGGERRRLQLMLTLAATPNVLLLDEPTNDLDIDTLRLVEEFLDDWPGTLVVVSHDRAFLERTVEDVVVVDRGRVSRWPGGYAAWAESRRRGVRAPDEPDVVPTTPRSGGQGPEREIPRPDVPSVSTLRHRLREAERALRRVERERDRRLEQLEAAGTDRERLAEAGAALAEAQARLDDAEEAWLLAAEAVEERSAR